MARKKKEVETPKGDTQALEAQVAALQATINELQGQHVQMPNNSLTEELAKLKKNQVRSAPRLPYRTIDDHVNQFLYTGSNHRVGPLHPNNAIETMLRWAASGVQLYTTKRTEEQVAQFKKSKVWIDFMENNRKTREKYKAKDMSKQFMEFTKIIARGMGKTPEEINQYAGASK